MEENRLWCQEMKAVQTCSKRHVKTLTSNSHRHKFRWTAVIISSIPSHWACSKISLYYRLQSSRADRKREQKTQTMTAFHMMRSDRRSRKALRLTITLQFWIFPYIMLNIPWSSVPLWAWRNSESDETRWLVWLLTDDIIMAELILFPESDYGDVYQILICREAVTD